MRKIPTLFKRPIGPDGHPQKEVCNEVNPGCEWVLAGEGVATLKMDGACCMVRDGKFYKRRECKGTLPADFEEVQFDENTGKRFGWVPVGDGPEDKYFREGWASYKIQPPPDGTYELIGSKVQGNPYNRLSGNILVRHGDGYLPARVPRDFGRLREMLANEPYEGIVFWRDSHDPDCDKAKIKKRDFGLEWPIKEKTE